MKHRQAGYKLLSGYGLEIGALHNPAPLQPTWNIEYADALTKAEQINVFPEVDSDTLREPDYICDLDKGDLKQFADEQFDFVILSHVIEHVANPIAVIEQLFRIVRVGGNVLIACPDKRYTFDKNRPITSLGHLIDEYLEQVTYITDDHYLDFLKGVHPGIAELPPSELTPHLVSVRDRREHAHVWDTAAFEQLLTYAFRMLNIQAECIYRIDGDTSEVEYFSVWRKESVAVLSDHTHDDLQSLHRYVQHLEQQIIAKNTYIDELELRLRQVQRHPVMRLLRSLKKAERS